MLKYSQDQSIPEMPAGATLHPRPCPLDSHHHPWERVVSGGFLFRLGRWGMETRPGLLMVTGQKLSAGLPDSSSQGPGTRGRGWRLPAAPPAPHGACPERSLTGRPVVTEFEGCPKPYSCSCSRVAKSCFSRPQSRAESSNCRHGEGQIGTCWAAGPIPASRTTRARATWAHYLLETSGMPGVGGEGPNDSPIKAQMDPPEFQQHIEP